MTSPRTRRILLAAVLGLLALAVAKVVWTVDARLVPAESGAATPQSGALPGRTALGSFDAVTTLPFGETERVVVAASDDEFGPNGLWLRLVESRSGLPSSDAKLRVWSPGEREARAELLFQRALENSELGTLLAEGTESVPVDASGRARLARSNLRRWAVAERDGAWGWSLIEPNGAGDVDVELVPDFSIDVRVREAGGAAVDDMSVRVRAAEGCDPSELLVGARTNKDGLARIEHVGWMATSEGYSPFEALRVGLAGPVPEPEEFEFVQASPPAVPVEFVAPEGGDVEILAVDADGRALSLEFTAQLALLVCNPADEADCREVDEPATALGRDGRAVFRRVPFGRKFDVWIESPGGAVLSDGESRVNSSREPMLLRLPCDLPTHVCGRAVDENGKPWAGTLLAISAQDGEERVYSDATVRTDDGGRFEFDGYWPTDLDEGFLEAETCGNEETRPNRVPVRWPVRLPGSRAVGACAGDLVLERVPLLASGRVTHPDGRPAQFVTVESVLWKRDVDRDDSGPSFAMAGFPSAITDDQGRFELRGELEGEHLDLYATASTAWSQQIEAPVGSYGLELRLEQTGSVRGRVLLGPERLADSLELELSLEYPDDSEPSGSPWALRAEVDRDGRFEFRSVLGGSWELTVWGDEGDLATIGSIDVQPGRTTLDPRLAAIELPAGPMALRCVDDRGWQALGLCAVVRPVRDPTREPKQIGLMGNLLQIPQELLPAEVWLDGQDFLPVHLPSVDASGTIEFVRAPILCLNLGGNDPEALRTVQIVIDSSEPRRLWPHGLRCDVGLDGIARTSVPFTGRVELRVRSWVPGPYSSSVDLPLEPGFVVLRPGDPPRQLDAHFDADALRAAMEKQLRINCERASTGCH